MTLLTTAAVAQTCNRSCPATVPRDGRGCCMTATPSPAQEPTHGGGRRQRHRRGREAAAEAREECSGGQRWSSRDGACVCPRSTPNWNSASGRCIGPCTRGASWIADRNECACDAATPEYDAAHDRCVASTCPSGQRRNRTDEHCCWPGQIWGNDRCRGIPTECPNGYQADAAGETCGLLPCGTGMLRMEDGVTCCYDGQFNAGGTCRGVPNSCPAGMAVRNEGCVALAPGSLAIAIFPEAVRGQGDTEVYLDGARIDTADRARHPLIAGRHGVRVVARGYTRAERVVEVRPNETTRAEITLDVAMGSVTIRTANPGAHAILDDHDLGALPLEGVRVRVGSHSLTVRAFDRLDDSRTFEVNEGEATVVDVPELARRNHVVRVFAGLDQQFDAELVGSDGSRHACPRAISREVPCEMTYLPLGNGRLNILRPHEHSVPVDVGGRQRVTYAYRRSDWEIPSLVLSIAGLAGAAVLTPLWLSSTCPDYGNLVETGGFATGQCTQYAVGGAVSGGVGLIMGAVWLANFLSEHNFATVERDDE